MNNNENNNIPTCTSKNKRFLDKVKEHKKKFAVIGVTIASVVGTILIFIKWCNITSYIKKS